mmetsp:Transcript_26374/g.81151  ORF Transcript_26374/g.81151 Transcript_26374/m.81151 type:complete len:300 (-) Transcript_26374:509-1408(-)
MLGDADAADRRHEGAAADVVLRRAGHEPVRGGPVGRAVGGRGRAVEGPRAGAGAADVVHGAFVGVVRAVSRRHRGERCGRAGPALLEARARGRLRGRDVDLCDELERRSQGAHAELAESFVLSRRVLPDLPTRRRRRLLERLRPERRSLLRRQRRRTRLLRPVQVHVVRVLRLLRRLHRDPRRRQHRRRPRLRRLLHARRRPEDPPPGQRRHRRPQPEPPRSCGRNSPPRRLPRLLQRFLASLPAQTPLDRLLLLLLRKIPILVVRRPPPCAVVSCGVGSVLGVSSSCRLAALLLLPLR